MADALADRRQKLYDERTTLETIRSCIHGKLALPSEAEKYITTQLGQDGSRRHGEQLMSWIDNRLKEVEQLLGKLPVVMTARVASVVDVIGRDRSQYATK